MLETPKQYYDTIAGKYDWFYASWDSASEEQRRQLTPLLRNRNVETVLDCGCGNGLQAIALAKAGFRVTGSDLSDRMLEQARRKCVEEQVSIPLVQADVRELREKIPGPFDAVICMGNVLPHLMNDEEIQTALENMRDVLRPGGLLVLEGRYYDELVRTKERFIPHRVHATEDGKCVSIIYVLDHFATFIRFHILFFVTDERGELEFDVDTVDYNPLVTEDLRAAVNRAGFGEVAIARHADRVVCTATKGG
jgi:glycine/sarcosine N-methyltransferase